MSANASTPIRNLLIVGNLAPHRIGGAETQCRLLALQLACMGLRVSVAGYANRNGRLSDPTLGPAAVRTHRLPSLRTNRLTRAFSYAVSLIWFLLRYGSRYDGILCYMLGESDLVLALLKWVGCIRTPLVVCTAGHGSGGEAQRLQSTPFTRFWVRLLNDQCDAINTLSPVIASELGQLGLSRPRLVTIPNGIALNLRQSHSERFTGDERRFLFVGRLVRLKGVQDLIAAMKIVIRRGLSVQLTIVGSGPMEPELREMVQDAGLGPRVTFLGTVAPDEMARVYGDHAVLVLPSHRESFGLVVAEAMASGMPVIVTRSGGPEFYVQPSMGRICPVSRPDLLADAMADFAGMPSETLARLGDAGRQHAHACLRIDRVAERYLELFRPLL